MITFRTNMGDFSIELDFDKAPITAANFLQYARDDFYTGTVFHRVISGFMVQGGGMDSDMNQKPAVILSKMKLITDLKTKSARSPWLAQAIHTPPHHNSLSMLPITVF